MRELKDIYGNTIGEGDVISMPHTDQEGFEGKMVNGYYITRLSHNAKRDKLVDDMGMGISFAFGIVKLNVT